MEFLGGDLSVRSTALRLDLALNALQHFYDLFSGAVRWVGPRDFRGSASSP